MVFFTCNACGQSIKKNKVEKHYQVECRSCEILSCMDCGKEFAGDEYQSHTSCISEAQKYQGALYSELNKGGQVPKGEKKQQEWLERIRKSVLSAAANPKIALLLERVAEYPNIPRKKAKFIEGDQRQGHPHARHQHAQAHNPHASNFVRNSLNVRDEKTLDQLWDAFGAATKPSPDQGESQSKQATGGDQHVGGEQGLQANCVGAKDGMGKVQTRPKKQKHVKKESDVTEGEGCSQRCESEVADCDGVCQVTLEKGADSGNKKVDTDCIFGTSVVAKKATKKKLDEKTTESSDVENNPIEESVTVDIENTPVEESVRKKSKKRNADNSISQKDGDIISQINGDTRAFMVPSKNSAAKKPKRCTLQGSKSEEGVAFQDSDGQMSKKAKRKHKSESIEDQGANVTIAQATSETVALKQGVRKSSDGGTAKVMQSTGDVTEPPMKKPEKDKYTDGSARRKEKNT